MRTVWRTLDNVRTLGFHDTGPLKPRQLLYVSTRVHTYNVEEQFHACAKKKKNMSMTNGTNEEKSNQEGVADTG